MVPVYVVHPLPAGDAAQQFSLAFRPGQGVSVVKIVGHGVNSTARRTRTPASADRRDPKFLGSTPEALAGSPDQGRVWKDPRRRPGAGTSPAPRTAQPGAAGPSRGARRPRRHADPDPGYAALR